MNFKINNLQYLLLAWEPIIGRVDDIDLIVIMNGNPAGTGRRTLLHYCPNTVKYLLTRMCCIIAF